MCPVCHSPILTNINYRRFGQPSSNQPAGTDSTHCIRYNNGPLILTNCILLSLHCTFKESIVPDHFKFVMQVMYHVTFNLFCNCDSLVYRLIWSLEAGARVSHKVQSATGFIIIESSFLSQYQYLSVHDWFIRAKIFVCGIRSGTTTSFIINIIWEEEEHNLGESQDWWRILLFSPEFV